MMEVSGRDEGSRRVGFRLGFRLGFRCSYAAAERKPQQVHDESPGVDKHC